MATPLFERIGRTLAIGAVFLLGTTACGEASSSDDGVVARVGEYELSVEAIADLLVNVERFPAQIDVIRQVADLWVDYTLLGVAAVDDSTFGSLDFEPLIQQQVNQFMIFQLRDSVIQTDTAISDLELAEIYAAEDPALEIRASHILMQFPPPASAAQRDTVRTQLLAIRARIEAGESFAALANQFSQDRGSGALGGDLGFFGRGDMVVEFEEAVLALEPGELSQPVETGFGLHLIRLDELRSKDFADIAADLRTRVQTERFFRAESTYVAGVEGRADAELTDGALDIVRELARNPASRLSGRAGRRALFDYAGGALTVVETQLVLQTQAEPFRQQVVNGTDDEIDAFLRGLLQRELLADEARASGLEPPRERFDSMVTDARSQLQDAAGTLRLTRLDRAPGEPMEQALERAVYEAVERVLTGATDVIELGVIGFQLRQGSSPAIFDTGVGQAVLRLGQLRANRSPSLMEQAVDSPGVAPDTPND